MLASICLSCLMAWHGPAEGGGPHSADEQYRALAAEYEAARRAFVKANDEARTEADELALDGHPGRKPRLYAPRFLALADANPGTTAAEDALIWICSQTFGTRECEEAKRRLVRQHVESAKLGPALGFQGHYSDDFEGTEAFFRGVLARSPHHEIRGQACYWLARHLLHKAEGVRAARARPEFGIARGVDLYADVYGADWAARLRRLDSDALEREAEALFERVARFYADIPHNDKRRQPGPLGEVARSYLRERRALAVGRPAPEIEGTDLGGRPYRLSDDRGRIVVLDFGSHFYCGQCRQTYPQLRALAEHYRGRPLSVVSINAEPEKSVEQLREAWAAEGNTWRCLFDDHWEGSIQKAWNIQSFPTIHVLDADGVIRFKDLRGRELDEAVGMLLETLEGAPGPGRRDEAPAAKR